jgi:hypothetical protein
VCLGGERRFFIILSKEKPMALNGSIDRRTLVVYSVMVRNHGPNGTFPDVEADLPRIRALGADAVWFLPIHPIGKVRRKGGLGSPYSISDYREVNPEYGTAGDFARLIRRAHALGLRVLIDAVFNHTAHDSVLAAEHPQYFHTDGLGRPLSTVPEWSDVIDLRHPHPGLTAALIDCMAGWLRLGVDGFRCDVASLVPMSFWREARAAAAKINPGTLWIAESVHPAFAADRRARGLAVAGDAELGEVFDLLYDYDFFPILQAAMTGRIGAGRVLEMQRFQEATLPSRCAKLRFTENHDQARTASVAPNTPLAGAWTAFTAFLPGAFLIHSGQESGVRHTPSLFDRDPVDWNGYPLEPFFSALSRIKKDPAVGTGRFIPIGAEPVIQAAWASAGHGLLGVFNVTGAAGPIAVRVPDGEHEDVLNGGAVSVRSGRMPAPESASVLRVDAAIDAEPLSCDLLDFRATLE